MSGSRKKCICCKRRRVLDDEGMCWDCVLDEWMDWQNRIEEHPTFDRKTRKK